MIFYGCELSITNHTQKEGLTGWKRIVDLILKTNIEHIQLQHMFMSKDDIKEYIGALINNDKFKEHQLKYIVMYLLEIAESDLDWIRENSRQLTSSEYMKHFFFGSLKLKSNESKGYSLEHKDYKCHDCQLPIPESLTPRVRPSANFKY